MKRIKELFNSEKKSKLTRHLSNNDGKNQQQTRHSLNNDGENQQQIRHPSNNVGKNQQQIRHSRFSFVCSQNEQHQHERQNRFDSSTPVGTNAQHTERETSFFNSYRSSLHIIPVEISTNRRSTTASTTIEKANVIVQIPITDQYQASSFQRTRECIVCMEEKSVNDFNKILSPDCVHHRRQICIECVRQYVRIAITNNPDEDLRCPEINCTTQFGFDVVQLLLDGDEDKQLLQVFEEYLSGIYLKTLPRFVRCAYCGETGGEVVNGDALVCDHCGTMTCMRHKTRWHTGMTCDDYDRLPEAQKSEDPVTKIWMETHTKQCPKCFVRIEKNGGCDHMSCIYCRYEFCWECFTDFNLIRRRGLRQHSIYCSHYRRN